MTGSSVSDGVRPTDHRTQPAETRNVLHVRIVTGTGGGPDKTILNAPRHLSDSPYRETACFLHPPGDPGIVLLEQRARACRCPFIAIADAGPLSPWTLRRLVAVCRANRIDVWHGHDYKSNLFGVLLRRRLGLKLVTTVHGWVKHTRRTPFYYALDRWTLPRHDQVIAVSLDLRDRCRHGGVAPDRLHLIENGIDLEDYRPRPPPAAATTTGPDRLRIGAIGRLSAEKGFSHLIDAVGRLSAEGLPVELAIAGEGEERDRLTAQAGARGLVGDRVRFLGYQDDVRPLLATLDVFCLSSLREGLPNVVLEAMAMAVPVVATRCGGLSAFENDAVLVPPGSVAALATALRRVLTDGALRAELASRGRARVERDFDFRQRMRRVAAVYDLLWDDPRPA